MDKKIHTIEYETSTYKNLKDSKLKELIDQTILFTSNAYAPYSHFKVSACLQLSSGEILKGANVENASYPVSICAERTVLSHAVSNYPNDKIEVITIYADSDAKTILSPCGLCRQTLIELETRQKQAIIICLIAKNGNIVRFKSAADLLPFKFDHTYL